MPVITCHALCSEHARNNIPCTVDQAVGNEVKRRVVSAMRDFPSSLEIQALSCQVLGNIVVVGMYVKCPSHNKPGGPISTVVMTHSLRCTL